MRPDVQAVVARPGLAVAVISSLCWTQDPTADRSNAWMAEDGGSLRIDLSRDDGCRGLLTADVARRLLTWRGVRNAVASNEDGCGGELESSFDDVESVRLRERPGFLMQFATGERGRMVLIPAPHAAWLATGRSAEPGQAAAALPYAVVADTRTAVDRIRAALGRSQMPGAIVREALYGTPAEVSIAELLEFPASYVGKAVRVHGRLESPAEAGTRYRLTDGDHALAVLVEGELGPFIQWQLPAWRGRAVDLVGRFGADHATPERSEYLVSAWECDVEGEPPPVQGRRATLQSLVVAPEAFAGQTVRVVGKFRGRNLFGDLPDRPGHDEWVLKDDRYAIWVIGKPAGAGFRLDPGAPADTRAWLEVAGTLVERDGRVALWAQSASLVPPPPGARVLPVRQTLAGREKPPAVVFAIPTEDEPVRPDVRFVIQFSKQMDEESFRGRIRMRYAGGAEGEGFRVTTHYDPGLRSVLMDPGALLQAGAEVEIQLLPGIIDADGIPLEPRPGRKTDGAVDVLRYVVGGQE